MSIRQVVYDQVKAVAQQQHKALLTLSDRLNILESGLDSLCVAIIIANLDDELDLRPFDTDDAGIPVTIGDLVRVYEDAAKTKAKADVAG